MCWENPPCSKQFLQDVYLGLGTSTQLGLSLGILEPSIPKRKIFSRKKRASKHHQPATTSFSRGVPHVPQRVTMIRQLAWWYLLLYRCRSHVSTFEDPRFSGHCKVLNPFPSTRNNMSDLKCNGNKNFLEFASKNNTNNILDLLISTLPLKRTHVSKPFPSPPPPPKKYTHQITHRL